MPHELQLQSPDTRGKTNTVQKKADQPTRPPDLLLGSQTPNLGQRTSNLRTLPDTDKRAPVKATLSKGSGKGQRSRAENSDNDHSILPKYAVHAAAQSHPCRLRGTPASSSIPGFQGRPNREPRLAPQEADAPAHLPIPASAESVGTGAPPSNGSV